MTPAQFCHLPGHDQPVLLANGLFGQLYTWPNAIGGHAGVKVPGDPGLFWVACEDLDATPLGALRERGAPPLPADRPADPQQVLLGLQWAQLGGQLLKDPAA